MTRKFLVTATHPIPKYGCTDAVATAHEYPQLDGPHPLWNVSMAGYGCSKNYRTAETAIREMLADHACAVVSIKEVE